MIRIKSLVLLAGALFLMGGCASTPIPTTLPAVVANPEQFRNKYIELTALVAQNPPPQGGDYRTWSFTVNGSGNYRLMASEEGSNPSTIDKAYLLVEDARKAHEPVTITGKLRVGPYRALKAGMEIELVSVRYRGTAIYTDKGPFVYYPYYTGPVFLEFGYYYHSGHSHHHH
jgi:hypothetical protein